MLRTHPHYSRYTSGQAARGRRVKDVESREIDSECDTVARSDTNASVYTYSHAWP